MRSTLNFENLVVLRFSIFFRVKKIESCMSCKIRKIVGSWKICQGRIKNFEVSQKKCRSHVKNFVVVQKISWSCKKFRGRPKNFVVVQKNLEVSRKNSWGRPKNFVMSWKNFRSFRNFLKKEKKIKKHEFWKNRPRVVFLKFSKKVRFVKKTCFDKFWTFNFFKKSTKKMKNFRITTSSWTKKMKKKRKKIDFLIEKKCHFFKKHKVRNLDHPARVDLKKKERKEGLFNTHTFFIFLSNTTREKYFFY